ncbi:MAG: xanthine dehydrogenase family protein molybdopterin-binding subunit [Rhizobacter sp.]|nr:xanthine dehydrogenase family protein molybdopterin-binding subunit [Bacteriovorax sp.]
MTKDNSEKTIVSRRDFMASSAVAVGGLFVAFNISPTMNRLMAAEAPAAPKMVYAPNAFIHIAPDNSITMVINKLEMGQGVNTSMAQLIAEELECDWTTIKSVSAPVNAVYNHTQYGTQMTGGSSALNSSWDQHRKIGAGMREMLKSAAAAKWGIPVAEVRAENGYVYSAKGKLSYGEVADDANKLPLPENPPLKNAKDFKIIGKNLKRIDALEKANGKAIYGMDVRIPGMVYACVARSNIDGGEIASYDEKAARAVSGVVDVVKFSDNKIAVLAKNTYAAKTGRDALNVKFKSNANDNASTEQWMKDFKELANKDGIVAEDKGSAKAEYNNSKTKFTAEYEFPFLAHSAMEPLNCTVDYNGKTAELWSGHQMPTVDRDTAAKVLGLKPENVNVHTTYAGGSFGRRASKNSDYVVQACELAKVYKKPLKMVMTREDDTHAGYYRPMTYHKVNIGLDDKNHLQAWDHHIVGYTVMGQSFFGDLMIKGGLESAVTEGVTESPYTFKNFRVEQTIPKSSVKTLWYRSVGHTHTAYVMETMIDELAHKSKTDPFTYRQNLLAGKPRQLAVLAQLKKMTGWGTKKAPHGRAWGLAIHQAFNSVIGQVAEVSIIDGLPHVHQVWCVAHCGQVVNPDVAKTQLEGGIVFGITSVLQQEITIKDGLVQQGNFKEMPVVRMYNAPVVHVEFVPSTDTPTGLGEPGVPPIAPAIANAVFQLTQKRLRVLPFSKGMKVV